MPSLEEKAPPKAMTVVCESEKRLTIIRHFVSNVGGRIVHGHQLVAKMLASKEV
jgi:hypothetical protein